jgi:hypothetical protein
MFANLWQENKKERDHLEDVDVDKRILKLLVRNGTGRHILH